MKYLLFIFFGLACVNPLLAQNEGAGKVNFYTEKIAAEPDSIKWYINRAESYMMDGRADSARADYEQVVSLYNSNPIGKPAGYVSLAYYKLAQIQLNNKQYEPALKNIKEALTLMPEEKPYLLQEARILAATPGKEKEAVQKYDNLVAAYPTDEKILLEYGKWVEPRDAAKAVILYEKVLRANVLNTDALLALGNYFSTAAEKLNDKALTSTYRNKAISYFQLLYKISPNYPGLKDKLIDLLEAEGRGAEVSNLKGNPED
ncbi:MAG: hypothetical protein NXI00_23820 [Cytophagales bacterium]|nr:hypothetical protein [Cytophagales bacterium]